MSNPTVTASSGLPACGQAFGGSRSNTLGGGICDCSLQGALRVERHHTRSLGARSRAESEQSSGFVNEQPPLSLRAVVPAPAMKFCGLPRRLASFCWVRPAPALSRCNKQFAHKLLHGGMDRLVDAACRRMSWRHQRPAEAPALARGALSATTAPTWSPAVVSGKT